MPVAEFTCFETAQIPSRRSIVVCPQTWLSDHERGMRHLGSAPRGARLLQLPPQRGCGMDSRALVVCVAMIGMAANLVGIDVAVAIIFQ